MSEIPTRVIELVDGVEQLQYVLDEIRAEWEPDPAPLTTAMSDVGRAFAEAAPALSTSDAATVLDRVETLLREGTDKEKDAVATGFLEAVATALDSAPQSKWVLHYAGEESRRYLLAWENFCGTVGG